MPADLDARQISARIRFVRAGYLCECRGECGQDHSEDDRSAALTGWQAKQNAEPEPGRCPAVHGHVSPATGASVTLNLVHLNHDESDWDEANLIAMCGRCRFRYSADHTGETRRRAREHRNGLVRIEGL